MTQRSITNLLDTIDPGSTSVLNAGTEQHIPIEKIQPSPYQPRRQFLDDSLEELAQSIRDQGLIQPIIVRRINQGRTYELVAGERRWRAAQRAGLTEITAIVRDYDTEQARVIALIENIQREDLNAMDQAKYPNITISTIWSKAVRIPSRT